MLPQELSDALNHMFGEYAQYIVIFFVLAPLAPRMAKFYSEISGFPPKQREERARQKRLALAERLIALQKSQKDVGLSLVDVDEVWRQSQGEELRDPFRSYSIELDRDPPSPGVVEESFYPSPMRVFTTSILPWAFGFVYGAVFFAGIIYVMVELFPEWSDDNFFGPAVISYLVSPFAAVFWCVSRLAPTTWRHGYWRVQRAILGRMIWLLPLIMLAGVLFLAALSAYLF